MLTSITVAVYIFFFTPGIFCWLIVNWGVLWIISAVTIFRFAIKSSFSEIIFVVLVVLNLYVNIAAIAEAIMNKLSLSEHIQRTLIVIGILIAYIPPIWILMVKLYQRVIEFNMKLYFSRVIWVIPTLTYLIFFVKIMNDYWINPVHASAEDIVFVVLWSFTTHAFFLYNAYASDTNSQCNKRK